jgi:hypothetical protein
MTAKLSVGLLLFTTLALTACSNRLDTTEVEAMIQADIERQGRRLSLRAVRCPTDVNRQAGAYFRCVGELDPEGTFTINVTQQDSQGQVTWEVPNSRVLLNLVKVEGTIQQGLSQALGKRALVDCGSATYRVNQPGDRFECQIVGGLTEGSDTINSVLVRVDPSGNLDWQELRTANAVTTGASSSAIAAAPTPPTPTGQPPGPAVAPNPAPAPVKTTTVTGPTGRIINRPYIRGDND